MYFHLMSSSFLLTSHIFRQHRREHILGSLGPGGGARFASQGAGQGQGESYPEGQAKGQAQSKAQSEGQDNRGPNRPKQCQEQNPIFYLSSFFLTGF